VAVRFAGPIHHAQHFGAAGLQESVQEQRRDNQEGDVELYVVRAFRTVGLAI